VRALLVVIALATGAHAETKLGFRFGANRIPFAHERLGGFEIALGVEHPITRKLRVMAEYEALWLSVVPPDEDTMDPPITGMGHRGNLGLRRTIEEKAFGEIRFYADVELGGGLGMYEGMETHVAPHGFFGLRGGYTIRTHPNKTALETAISIRAIVVESGIGLGGGLGFYWGG
jgi:hypothetical protein